MKLKIRIELWWLRLKLYRHFRFAHHPLCERFEGHVFNIGKWFFCQGCTLVYSGLLIGALLFSLIPISLPFWSWLIIAGALILPTFLVHFSNLPRFFTRLARLSFGFNFGWMIGGVVQNSDWVYRGILFGVALTTYIVFRIIYRRTKRNRDECEGCEELDQLGICSGYKIRMDTEREYSKIATKLLEPDLEKYVKGKLSSFNDVEERIVSNDKNLDYEKDSILEEL